MKLISWQRFNFGLRLILCSGPALVCVFSLAEFPEASGWWMLGVGSSIILVMLIAPAVGIVATRSAVWLLAVPFWLVRVRFRDIDSVASVDVRPLEDFGGWGVKGASRTKGLLLAADGQRAVRIVRVSGQVFLATCGTPERTVALIESERSRCREQFPVQGRHPGTETGQTCRTQARDEG